MKRILFSLFAFFVLASTAYAYYDPSIAAAMANLPTPRLTVPDAEAVGGQAGTAGTYLPGDAKLPRITRATTVTTTAGGVFSGTWATALGTGPNIVLTPIYSGTGSVNCFLTAAPTTTTFAGKCTTDQSAVLGLSIVTAGLTVGPLASASGMSIQVVAIPPTQ